MTVLAPQRAAGLSSRDHGASAAGAATAQPVVYARLNGDLLHFVSVASFHAWWSAQQRRNRIIAEG